MSLHWQMDLLLFGLMVMLMTIILGIGLVEGRIRGYWRAWDEIEAEMGQAPMLLCPRCGPATEPFRHVTEHEVGTLAGYAYQRIGRLN